MRADGFVVRRDGGIGNDRARLKRWITVCKDERTCRRVRRRGRASGSCGGAEGRRAGFRGARGDAGWLLRRASVGDGGSAVGADAVPRPWGTKPRIASSKVPLDERESARERASPRRSSTS